MKKIEFIINQKRNGNINSLKKRKERIEESPKIKNNIKNNKNREELINI